MNNRRTFIKSGAIAVFGISLGGVPAFIARAAEQYKNTILFKKKKVLICIFQRGAMDGLMAVSPFTDEYFKLARPTLFMSAAKDVKKTSLIDLDGKFGLHPSFSAFDSLFKNKQLAIVHGIGSPNNTRSHFDAQDYMESGTPFDKGNQSGWLNRAIGLMGHDATPFRAVSMTASSPRSLYGYNPTISLSNLQDFAIRPNRNMQGMDLSAQSFEDLYDQTTSGLFKETSKETFEAVDMLSKVNVKTYQPANGALYPTTKLGNSLKQLAQLIKVDVGLEIGFAESTGWDTHFNQGTDRGGFAKSATDLGDSIAAFWTDIGEAYQDEVTVMTMTEFGRTVKQNGSGGTDHGRASCNFILGNNVNGGIVYGDIKPLAIENLEDGRDLAVSTDFRSVFSEVADKQLLLNNDALLFPGWKGDHLKIMKG
ncbi:MAG: DUF1501 domain-containing protein [Bacteroidota bacterium]